MSFQSGAREELRIVIAADAHETSSATDYTVMPHSDNPTGPHKPGTRSQTNEVNADLQVQDNILRGFTAPFSFNGIWRYGIYDIPLMMVMGFPAWTSAVSITGTDIASAASGNKFTSVTTDKFNDLSADVPCVVWIKRDGATPLLSPAIAVSVVTGASPELVITDATGFGITLTVVAAGDNVTIMHSGTLKTGATEHYAIVERAQLAIGHYHYGWGMMCTKFDLSMVKESDPTAAFQFMGKDATDGLATNGTGTETAAGTFKAFNTGDDVQFFGEGGVFSDAFGAATAWALYPENINLSVESGASAINPLGINGPYEHNKDTVKVTGRFSLFTNDDARTIGQKQKANTDSSLFFMNKKTSGGVTNAYAHWIPRTQFVTTGQEGGGQGGQLTTPMEWLAAKDPTYGLTYNVSRFANMPL